MRIAFTNWSNRVAGGAETYISAVAPYLRRQGHELALWHESDTPGDREPIAPGAFSKSCNLEGCGVGHWVDLLKAWNPDVIFAQGLSQPSHEEALVGVAPTLFFAHNYHATCVSGAKAHRFPTLCACSQQFGPSCLVRFYPNRCGGLNPLTMLQDYKRTRNRLEVLSRYEKVLTHSSHMEREYRRHGIDCQAIPFFVEQRLFEDIEPVRAVDDLRLLFIGRMTELKGGALLLESLPMIAEALSRSVRVRFIGDGPARSEWERRGKQIERQCGQVGLEFTGWLSGDSLSRATADTDLHVLPSLWPEPYGLSGLELGLRSIPTAAFRVGGIPDWLANGVNGSLAEYRDPLAQSLAEAIVRAVSDPAQYRQLRDGARRIARSMTIENHCRALTKAFDSVRTSKPREVLTV